MCSNVRNDGKGRENNRGKVGWGVMERNEGFRGDRREAFRGRKEEFRKKRRVN